MKVVILGNTTNPITQKPNDPYSWFVKSFRDGFNHNNIECKLINYRKTGLLNIKRQLISYKPQYVFTHLSFHNNTYPIEQMLQTFSELNKVHNIKFIHTCSDARRVDRYMGNLSESFHCALVGTYPLVENGRKAWKIPTYYTPYSAITQYNIAQPTNELSFNKLPIFTGGETSHKDRWEFIKLLRNYGLQIKTFKTQGSDDMRERTQQLSSSATCILGLCTGYDIDGFADVRWVQYGGSGACLIMRKFTSFDKLLPDDLYYSFNSYSEEDARLVKKTYSKILNTDTWPMRSKLFHYIQQTHSSKVRIKQILDVLDGTRDDIL